MGLTPEEKKVIVFFIIALALGNAVLLYKKMHPSFASELQYRDLSISVAQSASNDSSQVVSRPADKGNLSFRQAKTLTGRIDINRAGLNDLQKLPTIGPAMAKKIIEFRKTSGEFSKIEDLKKVKGIGDKKFNKLREHVYVDH